MKKLFVIAIAVLLSHAAYAQLLDSKTRLYLGFMNGGFHGEKTIKEGSFTSPALYPNYDAFIEFPVKYLVKAKPFLSLGMGFTLGSASGWTNQGDSLYRNSKVKQYSFSPIIQLHSVFQKEGIFHRIRPFVEVAPIIGWSNIKLRQSLLYVSGFASPPMNNSDMFFGIRTTLGMDIYVTSFFGMHTSVSLQGNSINSKMYQDTSFFNSNIGVGVFFVLGHEKRLFSNQ